MLLRSCAGRKERQKVLRLARLKVLQFLHTQTRQDRCALCSIAQLKIEGTDKTMKFLVRELLSELTQKRIDMRAVGQSEIREILRGWSYFRRNGPFRASLRDTRGKAENKPSLSLNN